jgi:hypothetical protein
LLAVRDAKEDAWQSRLGLIGILNAGKEVSTVCTGSSCRCNIVARPNRPAGSARRYLLIASFLAASHTAKLFFLNCLRLRYTPTSTLSLWPFPSKQKSLFCFNPILSFQQLFGHPFAVASQTILHHRVRFALLLGELLPAHTFFACSFNDLTITTTDLLQQSSQSPCSCSKH